MAALTVVDLLDSFEHRVRELGPGVPDPAAVGQLGLYRCEEPLGEGVVERVADAANRREQSGRAETSLERLDVMARSVVDA